jgi:tetratricopeptide (TPR) repeat protein
VGALPRPDLPSGAQRDLNAALHELHHRAGWPSLRVLAREAGCSHTTVSAAFSSPRLPSWGVLELLVEAMHGDSDHFHSLWLAAGESARPATRPGTRLAGRRGELAAVRRHLESGRGLLVVAGEAGIGKSRLVGTAAELEHERVFVAPGSCLPLSTEVPLLPVADVLHAVHAVDDGQWVKEALTRCAPYVSASLTHLLPELETMEAGPDPSDDWARQRLFNAVERALSALAGLRPFAILVEDLHWADPATHDLLEHLLVRGPGVPVLGTWRSADPDTGPDAVDWFARVRRLPDVEVLELSALSRDETGEQLALLLPGHVTPDLVERVHRRTGGHPLFTEHLAADTTGTGDMPRLLAEVLDRRLQGLPDEAWRVARTLGVADRPLDVDDVGEAAGLAAEDVTQGLRELAGRRLLAERTDAREVRLAHPLLAEAIRRRVVASEAVDLHRRLAQVLAAGPASSAAEVATHWQAARDPALEREWRIRAAHAAEERFAMAGAAEQWLRVLELWPPGATSVGSPPVTWWTVCFGAVEALDNSGQIARSVDLVEEALTGAPDLPPEDAANVYARAGGYRTYFDNPRAGLPLLDRAIELFTQLSPSPGHLHALEQRAEALAQLGRDEEAAADLAAAMEVSLSLGDPVRHRQTCLAVAESDYALGDRSAVGRVAKLAALVLPRPDPVGDIRAASFLAALLNLEGAGPDQVETATRIGLEAASTWGITEWDEWLLLMRVAEAAWRAGDVARAAALIDPVTQGPPVGDEGALQIARALLDALRGEPTAMDRLTALDMIVPTLRSWFVPWAAQVWLWQHHPQQALDLLAADLDRQISGRFLRPGADTFALIARAAADVVAATPGPARRARRAELVRAVEQRASAADALPVDSWCAMDVARTASEASYAAELARLEERQTVEVWVAAATEWDRLSRPHESAYARWRAAQVALASGQGTVAAALLQRASRQARENVPLLEAIAATRG